MTPIAPYISAFLRERLPQQRGASEHTCTTESGVVTTHFDAARLVA